MARSSIDALVERQLAEEAGDLQIDMRLDWVRESDGSTIFTGGGVWDRRLKRYVRRGESSRIFRLHDGQVAAAWWIADWMRAHQVGQHLFTVGGKEIFSCGLLGGRRAGKSDLADDFAIAFAVAVPRSIVWIVLPAYPDMPEVERDLEEKLPGEWYSYVGEPWYLYTLANGSEVHLKSSHNPEALKVGRCDVAVIVEAQKHDPKVYAHLRPAIADEGGIVLMTANPPSTARGEWVTEWKEKADAGKIGAKVFSLDPDLNPHVDHAALRSLKGELDDRTYRREILGEFLAREDVVIYAFSPTFNVVEHPPRDQAITREFLRRRLGGRDFDRVHGLDFQLVPHMASATLEFWPDPDDPDGDPLGWYTDCRVVERGTEDELVDALEAEGFTGDDPVVPDASGEWQDAERKKGKASLDVFRRRGWRRIYLPTEGSTKNPLITERTAITNALFCSGAGKRKLFVDPRCIALIRALRMWENRNGAPNRRSDYAHIVDAATYPLCRLFPRRAPRGRVEYSRVERERSQRDRDLEVY